MKQKRKSGRKLLSFLLSLAIVFGTFIGIVPGTEITAKADTGVEVLIADINCEYYKDKTTSFTTDDGLANISFSATPEFDENYGWYNPNGDLTITVTAVNKDYPISKCVFQCCGDGREDSTAPFEVTISHGGNWQNTTATINGVTESSGGLRNIGFFSLVTPDYTALEDGMLIKPGESIIPGDYYYKTAERVNTDDPGYADFKKNTLYTLVKGNIESRQVDPSNVPDWYEDVFVESNNGDHYALLQVANGKYIFDGSWKITNHSDGLLVSQGTSENMSNPEERITTYAFSVHEKVFNDVMVDNTIENGSIVVKDSERTTISEAEAESTVTLEASPADGYKLDKISASYLEIQSVSELMEMMGNTKYYVNPNDTEYSDYIMATEDGIKYFRFSDEERGFLPKTAELDKSKSAEGIYTAIGTYDDVSLTWIFKVKNGKIISIGYEKNGVDWGIVNVESTGAIAEPTYDSVDLTTVTEGKKYTFTMPATDVIVNATFAVSSDSGSGSSSSGSSDNTNTNTDTSAKVPYDDVAISTGFVNDITGTATATAESNPFETKIENNDNLTTLLALTPEEVAQGVNVWLDIQDMSATVPQADKDLVQNASTNYIVGMYLDINLFKKVGGNAATKVIETNGKVQASIVIPESLRKSGRTFEIIRVHDGVATAIEGTYDENTHVFTFETDKFSTYALAYKDSASSGDSGTTSDSDSSNNSNSTQPTAPETGDPNDIRLWYLLLIASLGGLGFLGLSKKKKVND